MAVETQGRLDVLVNNAGVMDYMQGVGRCRTMCGGASWGYLQPDDIASLVLFLALDESRHVNGAIIPADAGWAAV